MGCCGFVSFRSVGLTLGYLQLLAWFILSFIPGVPLGIFVIFFTSNCSWIYSVHKVSELVLQTSLKIHHFQSSLNCLYSTEQGSVDDTVFGHYYDHHLHYFRGFCEWGNERYSEIFFSISYFFILRKWLSSHPTNVPLAVDRFEYISNALSLRHFHKLIIFSVFETLVAFVSYQHYRNVMMENYQQVKHTNQTEMVKAKIQNDEALKTIPLNINYIA